MPGITRDEILSILRDSLYIDTNGIADDTPLFSSGLIDSFSLASLLVELESRVGFTIDALDINLDNLDTIARIIRFVSSKMTAA